MNKRKILTLLTALTMGLSSLTAAPAYVVAEDITAAVSASEENVVKGYGDIVFQSSRVEKSVYAGEKVSFDDIELRVANYLDSNDPDASIIPEIDSFTVGSGKYSDLYTLDTSDVDTTQTGQYLIKLRPKAGSSLKVSTKYDTTYDLSLKGKEKNIWVHLFVYDKEKAKDTPLYLRFFTEAIEVPAGDGIYVNLEGAMASDVRYEVEDETIAKVGENSNPDTLVLNALKEGETTVNVYTSDGRKTSEKVRVMPSRVTTRDPDAPLITTTTTLPDPNAPGTTKATTTVTTIATVDKWWYEYEGRSTTTTTAVWTAPVTTSTVIACFAPKIEFNTSDLKVGEKRAGQFYNPETGKTENGSVKATSENISVEYYEGTDIFVVTALKAGPASLSINEKGCAFTGYVSFNVTNEVNAATTTTTEPEVWRWGTGVDHFDSIKTLPTKTIYDEGEDLDLSGLVVNAYHSATKYSNKGNYETVRTDYVWDIEEIKPEYITIRSLTAKTYTADEFGTLKGGNAYIVDIGKNSAVYDMKVAGEQYTKDIYDTTPDFSFRVYINAPDSKSKFIKIDNAEVESFGYGTTSHGFKLKGMDAFSIDMDAHMHVGYSIESGIRKGDKVSGVLYIAPDRNYIICGDLDIVKYGGEKGDANADGSLDMADVVMIMQALANPNKYGLDGSDGNHITKRGNGLGDMDGDGLTVGDAQKIQLKLLGLGEDNAPTTPTTQPVDVETVDEAIKLIKDYDLNDYYEGYRDSLKDMFESFRKDGYIYSFAEKENSEKEIKLDSLSYSKIWLMPRMEYEDKGIMYHVRSGAESYQVYYYFTDPEFAELDMKDYVAERLNIRKYTKTVGDKYVLAELGDSDLIVPNVFFRIDDGHYCKVRGNVSENEMTSFLEDLTSVKIPLNDKLTTDDSEKYLFEAQYIRVYATGNYNREPVIEMFNSEEELHSTYYTNSQNEKYDEKWFSEHKLILITLEEGSGSIRHKVTELTADHVAIDRITTEVMTCDWAIWKIYIELDKDAAINEDFRAELTETEAFDA